MADFLDFVVRDSLLNPLTITLLSTDLEQIDEGTRHGIDAQIDDTDPLGRKGAILAESVQENGLKTGNSQSVSLNTSQSLSSLVSSNLQHIAGCNCSFCALPPFDPNLVKNQPKQSAATVSAALNLSQTFSLNSLAGANHTIYLDFNGHTTSGTSWNTAYNKANIVTPAFDFDGNTGSFSNAELERIQYIWQRVAEDFIPFNVNVTTQAPTDINDLIKSGTGDTRWGVRVAIGGSSYDWFGAGAGGVAYVGSFNWNSDTPTFVFDDQLGNGNEKYTAEAISHEVGHTLGLSHDGRITPSEGYYAGHGSGDTGWAPIMGVGYYQNLSQWSKGEYASANNTQDDLQIITTQNGFGYRTDDTGSTIATAKALTVSGTSVSGNGIIERNTDVDFYSFTTGAGAISLTVNPFNRGPNLDILAELYNSAGTLIASSNPTDLLSANITANVAAGTYYLKIDGVGKGSALSTGYTDYGSLGQYSISGSVLPILGYTSRKVDFNGDGKDDILRQEKYADGIRDVEIYYSNGNSFNSPVTLAQWSWACVSSFAGGTNLIVGDFNGDKKSDILRQETIADNNSDVSILYSDGYNFNVGLNQLYDQSVMYAGFGGGTKLLVGDFNGDGKDDILRQEKYADGIRDVEIYYSNGNSFNSPVTLAQWSWACVSSFAGGTNLIINDFNGDGKDDILRQETIADNNSDVSILYSDGYNFNVGLNQLSDQSVMYAGFGGGTNLI
ncbi:FG-GAP-like repeat-containing protein [Microcystis wesenbergii]|uniref:FG-GAP-like repeat-containing protein n=1 Tax=Microcystis wesenbergii TaxID=44823 RepID=UPI001F54F792|nr:FG-GAP-like repeat-containing protein [Microcystis wesenbergii]